MSVVRHPRTAFRQVDFQDVPDGQYLGLWSGYTVRFVTALGERFHLEMGEGIRGIDCRCTVSVSGPDVEVQLLEG